MRRTLVVLSYAGWLIDIGGCEARAFREVPAACAVVAAVLMSCVGLRTATAIDSMTHFSVSTRVIEWLQNGGQYLS